MVYGNNKLPAGHAAAHPSAALFPVLAAPSSGKEKNVIRQELTTVACWRMNDTRFDLGSCFVVPDSKDEFEALGLVIEAHPGAPMSVFGHADPVGDDAFNKTLSGQRAEAIYAILTHDAARWEKLYTNCGWSSTQINLILKALGYATVTDFQKASGLTPDGVAGKNTRAALFPKYFAYLFPKPVTAGTFLGQGADAAGKAAYQGCSEFNPAMVFSSSELQTLSSEKRTEENAVNRRVLVLFFRPGTVVPPEKWPCPRATEGTAGCTKRFWSDGNARRGNQSARREFAETGDTFACRFYHRLVRNSPCESASADLLFVEIFIDVPKDDDAFEDQYQLVSNDGEYNVTLPRSQAIERGEKQVVLIFTSVISGLSYTLRHYPNPEVSFTVFENVPFHRLNNAGGGAARLRVLAVDEKESEPEPPLVSGDPLLEDHPADHDGPETWYADPHTSGGAFL